LLTDKDQAIPVLVLRNGLRSIAYGRGQSGVLDLRYMSANADIQKGDMLVTSGIDGVYPSGLAVATVTQAETKSSDTFAHIVCTPVAGVDRHKQLLILLVDTNVPPRPPEVEPIKYDKNAKLSLDVHDKPLGKAVEKAPVAGAAAAVKLDAKPVVATLTPAVKPTAATPAATPEAKPETKSEIKPTIPPKPAPPAVTPAATPSQPPKVVR
jgi:rod shape-determining protein MreC